MSTNHSARFQFHPEQHSHVMWLWSSRLLCHSLGHAHRRDPVALVDVPKAKCSDHTVRMLTDVNFGICQGLYTNQRNLCARRPFSNSQFYSSVCHRGQKPNCQPSNLRMFSHASFSISKLRTPKKAALKNHNTGHPKTSEAPHPPPPHPPASEQAVGKKEKQKTKNAPGAHMSMASLGLLALMNSSSASLNLGWRRNPGLLRNLCCCLCWKTFEKLGKISRSSLRFGGNLVLFSVSLPLPPKPNHQEGPIRVQTKGSWSFLTGLPTAQHES